MHEMHQIWNWGITFRSVAELHPIDFDQCRDVLKFLAEENPEQEFAEFCDVYYGVSCKVLRLSSLNSYAKGSDNQKAHA
ncbi:hypothetical protein BDR07DRAFT_1616775 [Suillus spraguei]|nr:hypothetical protein BDR07DRAFT_1616775 [Suillus spraguei]